MKSAPCCEQPATCGIDRELDQRWNTASHAADRSLSDIHPETKPAPLYHSL